MPSETGSGMPRAAKIGILSVVAAAGVAWAGWTAYSSFKPQKPRSRMITDIGGGGPARSGMERRVARSDMPLLPIAEGHTFGNARSTEDRAAQIAAATDRIRAAAGEVQPVRDVGPGAAEQLATSAAALFEPLFDSDVDAYFDAVETLGGKRPAEDNTRPRELFQRFASTLGYASIDTSKITIHPIKTGKGADAFEWGGPGNIMMMTNRNIDDQGNERNTTTIKVWPDGLFDDVTGFVEKGMRAVEVRAPVQTRKGEGDLADMHLGVVLVWVPSSRTWQPAVWNLYVHNQALMSDIMPRLGG